MKIEIEIEQDGRKKIFTKEFTRAEAAEKSFAEMTAEAVTAAKEATDFHNKAKFTVHRKPFKPGYYDSAGKSYELAERLGAGGEGTVYLLKDSPLVAKIYHEPVTDEKAAKLVWMAANKNDQLLKVAAWVVDVLKDAPHGRVIGFLMPSVRAKEIHELYSLKSRRVYFPEATWHFLIHTAANVARAFYSLHKNGHIMGDVNHGNCVVLADGRVKLIDCDSYSIKTDKLRYPCEVGVATHLAPELHGANLSQVERLDKHDNFGMAVIIFQLLFLGRHPFAGNYLGAEDKSIEDCIREYRFAYGTGAARRNVAQPPGTLPLEAVSPRVAELFERALTTSDDRPEPREWIEALEDLADSLEQCPAHPGHLFYEKSSLCPWCEIEAQTGVMVFPFLMNGVQLKNKERKDFDAAAVETLVAQFETQTTLPEKLKKNPAAAHKYLKPAAEIVEENQKQRNQQGVLLVSYAGGLFLLSLVIGSGCAFVLGIVALIILYSKFGDAGKMLRADARERLTRAQQKWHKLESDWTRLVSFSETDKNLSQLKQRLADYRELERNHKVLTAANGSVAGAGVLSDSDAGWRGAVETEIGNLLAMLRVGAVRCSKYKRQIENETRTLARELAQAESNVKFLGSNLPVGALLILISLGVPIFSGLVLNSFKTAPLIQEPPSKVVQVGSNMAPNPPPIAIPKIGVFVPEENISNGEILKLSDTERNDIVSELIRQSDAALGEKKYDAAEKKIRFAMRFNGSEANLLKKLGNIYYEQGKYHQSIEYLNKSKAIDNNDGVRFSLGMNYLQIKNYAEAREIFLGLTNGAMKNNASFYNLGAAYQGLGQYQQAIGAYQRALNFEPNDIDSTFQMGVCFSKLGNAEQVNKFYLALLEKDAARAEQFKKAVGKSFNLELPAPVQNAN